MNSKESIRQLNLATYNLAKKCVDTTGDRSNFPAEAKPLLMQFNELAEQVKGKATPDMQRMLSEIDLELDFLFNQGRGPTSVRIAQYQREKES
jgi:hypothetical protein